MDDEAVVDFKGLKEHFGITYSRTSLVRLEKERKFPKRLKPLGYRNSHPYWRRREIRLWLQMPRLT
jgi:predicted DNA-binding transcriptional regulator AlpA